MGNYITTKELITIYFAITWLLLLLSLIISVTMAVKIGRNKVEVNVDKNENRLVGGDGNHTD